MINTKSGKARQLLENHPSTKSKLALFTVEDIEIPAQIHADGIALSPDKEHLYYKALSGNNLFRVNTRTLTVHERNDNFPIVEKIHNVGVSDGMIFDNNGNLFSQILLLSPEIL